MNPAPFPNAPAFARALADYIEHCGPPPDGISLHEWLAWRLRLWAAQMEVKP
jgi:hypothetical protein